MKHKLPDFICIGAQRAGSTWLYENFKAHDGIWQPPLKELHYFDELRVQSFFCKRYKTQLRARFNANRISVRQGDWSFHDFLWDLHYFGLPRSDHWYSSVFAQGRKLVAGDITPAYSTLSAEAVAAIKRINPDMKVIFLMRDPIDRAWSQARKDLPRVFNSALPKIPEAEVIAWFNKGWCALRSDYIRTLDHWLAHFPRRQFFFGFFEEIVNNPQDLLLRIYEFLEVESAPRYVAGTAGQAVNAIKITTILPKYEYELAKMYEPMLARLQGMFESYPVLWHRRCVEVLNQHG